MADILIRNIDDETLERLKKKAMANNRSMNAEIKSLLEKYAGTSTREEAISMIAEARVSYEARKKPVPDLMGLLREDRDR
ncbi:MAG: Arc family DNA-binding protein [Cyclonatronaceae bacterium]